MKCFKCEQPIVQIEPRFDLIEGAHFSGGPGYGSGFDSCLAAEEYLRLVVCDDCLEEHAKLIERVYRPRPESPDPIIGEWNPSNPFETLEDRLDQEEFKRRVGEMPDEEQKEKGSK